MMNRLSRRMMAGRLVVNSRQTDTGADQESKRPGDQAGDKQTVWLGEESTYFY